MDNRTQQKDQELLKLRTISRILTGRFPSAKKLCPSLALFSQKCLPNLPMLLAEISASPHLLVLLQGILSSVSSLHLMLFTSAKTLFRKTNVYGCTHNIGKHASQAIKEAAQNVLQAAARSSSAMPWARSSLHYPRAHRDHSAPKDLECRVVALCKAPHHSLHSLHGEYIQHIFPLLKADIQQNRTSMGDGFRGCK